MAYAMDDTSRAVLKSEIIAEVLSQVASSQQLFVAVENLRAWAERLDASQDDLHRELQKLHGQPGTTTYFDQPAQTPNTQHGAPHELVVRPSSVAVAGDDAIGAVTAEDREEDPDDEDSAVALQESIWDASLLVGIAKAEMGFPCIAWTIGCIGLNVLVQTTITSIIVTQMTASTFDEAYAAGLRNWRVNIAHALKHADPITGVPLAVRVCANDPGLEYSSQAADFQAIVGYTRSNVGPLLTALCCFMWLVTVVTEVAACLRVTAAVVHLRGAKTEISEDSIKSISTARVGWFMVVQAIRLSIAVLLAYGGSRFLTSTIPLDDLILNTARYFLLE